MDSPHALLEHRVTSGLTDDDVGPLHHHDADEECCVTRELHDLPLLVGLHREETERLNADWNEATPMGRAGSLHPTHCCP